MGGLGLQSSLVPPSQWITHFFLFQTLVLIGASGSSRRALKNRIIHGDPDQVNFYIETFFTFKSAIGIHFHEIFLKRPIEQ